MKTKLKLFALIFAVLCAVVLLMPNQVMATEELVEVATYEELRDALESGKSVKLMDDIEITETSGTGRNVGVAVIGAGEIIVDGNGFAITDTDKTARRNFEIFAEGGNLNVTFKNIEIHNVHSDGAAVCTRTDKITLNLENVKLTAYASTAQALSIGGPTGPVNVNITNSELDGGTGGYGIITFNPVNMNIEDTTIQGYSALYMKGPDNSLGSKGSKIVVKKSKLDSANIHSGDTNSFSTVVFEDDGGIELEIIDSELIATATGDQPQSIFQEQVKTSDGKAFTTIGEFSTFNTITISGKSVLNGSNEILSSLINDIEVDDTKFIINEGTISNVDVTKYIANGLICNKIAESKYEVSKPVQEVEVPSQVQNSEKVEDILLGSLKENENFAEIIENNNVEVKVELTEDESKVDVAEKQKIEETIKKENVTVAKYLDITVAVKNADSGEHLGNLEQLKEEITFTISIPDDLPKVKEGLTRKYYIIRNHNGVVEFLDVQVSKDGKLLNFKTDKFSTYALAYEDVPVAQEKDDTPKTGAINAPVYVWVALATIALAGIITTKKSSKHSK